MDRSHSAPICTRRRSPTSPRQLEAARTYRPSWAVTLGGAHRVGQVLVVTHAAEVKEQLPAAIEVVPLANGRSEARLAGAFQPLAIVP